jgi:1-acyl-sn-glycerol-3-phosphate acyltransferase
MAHNIVYYRKFRIDNPENIPAKGIPTLVIANHQNGMMDAMAILHALYKQDRRQPIFIARGDIFKKDSVAKVLRFLKILPVFRNRDGGRSDIEKDLTIFSQAADILRRGRSLVIFPEAGHQQGHYMSTFKKGFSRIAFTAEEANDYKLNLQILPINIHYSNYFDAREDLTVTCGKPFSIEEFFDLYKETPNPAYLALNEKSRARVKEMTPDIDIPEYYKEIDELTHIMREPILEHKGVDTKLLSNQKKADMETIAAVHKLRDEHPDRFTALMGNMQQYLELLKQTGLNSWAVNRKVSGIKMVIHLLTSILLLPIFLFGYLNNLLPSWLSKHFAQKVDDPMMHSTFLYGIGIFVFPIWYIILLVVASLVSHHFWIGLLYILLSAITGVISADLKKAFRKLGLLFKANRLRNTETYQRLCGLNTKVTGEMGSLLF